MVKEAETKTEGVAQIPGHLSIHVEQLPATPKAPKDPLSRFGGAFGVIKKASPTAMRVKHCSCSRAKRADWQSVVHAHVCSCPNRRPQSTMITLFTPLLLQGQPVNQVRRHGQVTMLEQDQTGPKSRYNAVPDPGERHRSPNPDVAHIEST